MAKIRKKWTEFKAIVSSKILAINMEEDLDFYYLTAPEGGIYYYCDIAKEGNPAPTGSEQEDFELNYKSNVNKPLNKKTPDGKPLTLSISRPDNTYTMFTTAGDNVTVGSEGIGTGKRIEWDFSNSQDEITAPTGFKRKRIEIKFLDPIWVKEGTIYFHNSLKGSYVDFYIVCPTGQYYIDNAGNTVLASVDTPVVHYVNMHPIQGSVPMGDELNTEGTSENATPNTYKMWAEVTVPDTDVISNGCIEMELYRTRTVIL